MLIRKDEFDLKSQKLNQEISMLKSEMHDTEKTIKSIKAMVNSGTLYQEIEAIRANKTLLKQLTDEYIQRVTMYPIFEKYSLVIINFKDGSESWGTIKSAKYRSEELWFDRTYCKVPHYIYQLLNNDDKSAEYNHENKTVIYKGKTITISNYINPVKKQPEFEIIQREGKNPTFKMLKSEIEFDESNSLEITIPDPYVTIEAGTYPIKEFIYLLKEDNAKGHNSNGCFPPYDFHQDEKGNDDSKEKAKQYRLDNAEKRNARNRELRVDRRKQKDI
jgi:hypothetical protein